MKAKRKRKQCPTNCFTNVPAEQVDKAILYITKGQKVPCLGRDKKLSGVIQRIEMPVLPLLRSNREQRRFLEEQNCGILKKIIRHTKKLDLAFMAPFDPVVEIEGDC